MYKHIIHELEAMMFLEIKAGNIGAVSTTDEKTEGYYLIRWTQPPNVVTNDFVGDDGSVFKKGEMMAMGEYFYQVPRARRWYTSNDLQTRDHGFPIKEIHLKYVVSANVEMEKPSRDGAKLPNGMDANFRRKALERGCKRITDESHEMIKEEIDRRESLEHEVKGAKVVVGVEDGSDVEQEEEDNSDRDDD